MNNNFEATGVSDRCIGKADVVSTPKVMQFFALQERGRCSLQHPALGGVMFYFAITVSHGQAGEARPVSFRNLFDLVGAF